MKNQERRFLECPFPNPDLWVASDENLAEFKSAGTHKLTRLSTAQKIDLFLAFKSKDENRGILSKIARYLDMGHANLSVMVQTSREYQEFLKSQQTRLSNSIFPNLNSKDIASETTIPSEIHCADCSQLESQGAANEGEKIENVVIHNDVNVVETFPSLSSSQCENVALQTESVSERSDAELPQEAEVVDSGPCPLHFISLEASWRDVESGDFNKGRLGEKSRSAISGKGQFIFNNINQFTNPVNEICVYRI